jgi:hypothetical protein
MKKSVDIEKLLQWAIREELPKGKAASAEPWEILRRFGELGGIIVDGGGPRDNLGFVPGEPHPDALAIARTVNWIERDGRVSLADLASVHSLLGDYAALDHLAVKAIMAAHFNSAALVITCAIQARRPQWDVGTPTPRAVMRETTGRPAALVYGTDADGEVTILRRNKGSSATRYGAYDIRFRPYCPLAWETPTIGVLAEARAEFVVWHRALTAIARDLAGQLQDYEPLPPACSATPWSLPDPPAPRVFQPEKSAPLAKLPVAPKRGAPRPPLRPKGVFEGKLVY